ncbi:hypothetical protein RJ640_005072 [Escallonia rubra]|uniref:Defective in cullin neddylation protein n=1 Tax=Escallonia rubra TaxID=112253 RepID=A0AA88QLV9_9ASTE|nr:hypothetical protein RJ640_005072 [Escallonia rubra]
MCENSFSVVLGASFWVIVADLIVPFLDCVLFHALQSLPENKLGRGNRDKVQQFMTITGASEKLSIQALKASDWHLEGAFDVFYNQPHVTTLTDSRHLVELYKKYKGKIYQLICILSSFPLLNALMLLPL